MCPAINTLTVGSTGTHAVNQNVATEEFANFVKSEVEKWGKVVAATGMTAD
jgi:hypothetical protein